MVSCVAGLLIVVVSSEAIDDFAAIVVDSVAVVAAGFVNVVIYSVVGDDLLGAAVVITLSVDDSSIVVVFGNNDVVSICVCVVSVLVSYLTPFVVTSIALVDGTVVCVSECCLTGTVVVSSCNGCDVGVVVNTVVVLLEYVHDGSWSVVNVGIVVVSAISTVLVIGGVVWVCLTVIVDGAVVSVFSTKPVVVVVVSVVVVKRLVAGVSVF